MNQYIIIERPFMTRKTLLCQNPRERKMLPLRTIHLMKGGNIATLHIFLPYDYQLPAVARVFSLKDLLPASPT